MFKHNQFDNSVILYNQQNYPSPTLTQIKPCNIYFNSITNALAKMYIKFQKIVNFKINNTTETWKSISIIYMLINNVTLLCVTVLFGVLNIFRSVNWTFLLLL